jgi:hypothetical protein
MSSLNFWTKVMWQEGAGRGSLNPTAPPILKTVKLHSAPYRLPLRLFVILVQGAQV